jgi:hypothetical protein
METMDTRETPMPPASESAPRALPRFGRSATWPILAIVYGFVVWAIVIGLAMLVGRWILPGTDSSRLIPALVGIQIATAIVAGAITVDFLRRSRAEGSADGLRFGAWATVVGMTADGVLLIATDFDLPGISEDKTLTLIAALFFGYPVTLLAAWIVAAWRLRGR